MVGIDVSSSTCVALTAAIETLLERLVRVETVDSTAPKGLAMDARLIWRCGSW